MAGKLCFLVLMNSPRKGAGRPTVLLDMRPLQGPSGGRGVGAYARGLLGGLIRAGFDSHMTLLLDVAFDEPELPPGGYRLAGCRRRSHGQLAAYEDAVALTADIQRIAPDGLGRVERGVVLVPGRAVMSRGRSVALGPAEHARRRPGRACRRRIARRLLLVRRLPGLPQPV